MKFYEFKSSIESVFSGRFGQSYCKCSLVKSCGQYISIDCLMAKDAGECSNGITSNDMMNLFFSINLPKGWNAEDDLPENMVMECNRRSIKKVPDVSYLYCSFMKIPFRKVSGDGAKLISSFAKFVDKAYNEVGILYRNNNLLPEDMRIVASKGYY